MVRSGERRQAGGQGVQGRGGILSAMTPDRNPPPPGGRPRSRPRTDDPRATAPEAPLDPAAAVVLYHGRRISVAGPGIKIGRLPECDVTIASSAVSREHAQIKPVPGGYWIVDLNSRNGTQVNGERIRGESRWLVNGDTVLIGGEALRFLTGQETRFESSPLPLMATTHAIQFPGDRMTIGRDSRQRRRARGPQRLALPRRGRPHRRPHRGARPRLAQRHAPGRRADAARDAGDRLGDRDRALPAHLRRRGLRPARRAGRDPPGRRGRRHDRQGQQEDPAADGAEHRARRARRDHRRERLGQVDAAEGAGRRHAPDRGHDHRQRRAARQPPDRHRLPAPGRGRPRGADRHRGARLRRAPAAAARHDRRGVRRDRRPRAGGARAARARPDADRLAVGRPAQARRPRRRAARAGRRCCSSTSRPPAWIRGWRRG